MEWNEIKQNEMKWMKVYGTSNWASHDSSSILLEPRTTREERHKEWWKARTDAVGKSMPQDTQPAYVTSSDHWEACQKLLNRH